MQLCEKYRPRRLAQLVGQDKVVKSVRRIISRKGWDRAAFWVEGPTGTGKTTLARALAAELGCDKWTVDEIDGDQCSVERVRQISESIELGAWGGSGWRCWIINEAQAMTARSIQAWLTLLERLPQKRLIVFTTTEDSSNLFGNFSEPFMGRVIPFRLTKIGLCEKFARLAYGIARREGLNGRPLADYQAMLGDCHNSMRAALNRVERGDMLDEPEHSEAIKKMIAGGKRAQAHKARSVKRAAARKARDAKPKAAKPKTRKPKAAKPKARKPKACKPKAKR